MFGRQTIVCKLSPLHCRLIWKGGKVVIARAGKTYLDLIPHCESQGERKPGLLKGKNGIAADFKDLSESIISDFEGS